MKHHLINTSLYGIGAGICIYISILNRITRGDIGFCSSFLVILILVMFLIKEILSRTNSESPDSKSQKWGKISLFSLLALSGVGLPSIWISIEFLIIDPTIIQGSGNLVGFILYLTVPISLFYGAMAFAILLRLFTTAENEASVKNNAVQDEVLATGDLVVTKFNISQSLLVAAISCGVAGVMYAIGTSLSSTFFILFTAFFYLSGDFISGMTIVYVLEQLVPSIRSKGIQIVFGFMIGSILDLLIGHPIYYSFLSAATNPFISQFVWNFFSIIAAPITMSVVIGKISKGSRGRVFGYWLFANVLQNLFYVTTSSNPIIVSFIGMAIFGVVGCFLTIKEIQKSIPNISLNTQE